MVLIGTVPRLRKRTALSAVALGIAACSVGVTVAFAGTDQIGPAYVGPKQAYLGPSARYLTGVYAADDSPCGCHTVGAGRLGALGSVSYSTGAAYRSFPGTYDGPVIVNGTSSLTLLMHGHANF